MKPRPPTSNPTFRTWVPDQPERRTPTPNPTYRAYYVPNQLKPPQPNQTQPNPTKAVSSGWDVFTHPTLVLAPHHPNPTKAVSVSWDACSPNHYNNHPSHHPPEQNQPTCFVVCSNPCNSSERQTKTLSETGCRRPAACAVAPCLTYRDKGNKREDRHLVVACVQTEWAASAPKRSQKLLGPKYGRQAPFLVHKR